MATNKHPRRKYAEYPGILIECKSGRFLAYYDHRTDIIAHGDNEVEAKKNLKQMYHVVIGYEQAEEKKQEEQDLPASFKTKKFIEKIIVK